MAVMLLKLLSGEDIVADVEITDEAYLLKKSIRLVLTPEGILSAPLGPLKRTAVISINKSFVIYATEELESNFRNSYFGQTGGVAVANPQEAAAVAAAGRIVVP
jgi:hypothetical protein